MIVPVLVGPLAGHANSLSAPLQRPIRSVQSKYCESTMHPVYHAKITVSTKNFPRSEGRKCGVKGAMIVPVLVGPSKYCKYVLYRMYYRYHTERRNSLSAPLRPYSA